MNPFLAIARGLRAAITSGSFVALSWMYGLLAVLAAGFTVFVFVLVSHGVANSAVGSQLRSGMSADWLIDTVTQPGAGSKVLSVVLFGLALALVYSAASIALSGGVVSRVVDAVAGGRPDRSSFLSECGRYAGPMLRVSVIEFIFLGIVGTVLALAWGAGLTGGAGNTFAWVSVAIIAITLSTIAAVADVARVHVVAAADRSALSAWKDAISHAVQRAPSFMVLVLFNLSVAVIVGWIALTIHGTISRETGGGVIAALIVGQLGIIGRIWARLAALATQASLRRLAG